MTTREVAVELGLSDAMVRYYRDRGDLIVLEAGNRGKPTVYDSTSVDALGIQLRLGKIGADIRTVTIHRSLERERLALNVSGLVAESCADVLEALDRKAFHRPILIWPESAAGFDVPLLEKFCTRAYVVIVGDPKQISERVAKHASWVAAGELRELTIHVWELVDRRHRNATLKI